MLGGLGYSNFEPLFILYLSSQLFFFVSFVLSVVSGLFFPFGSSFSEDERQTEECKLLEQSSSNVLPKTQLPGVDTCHGIV